MGGVVAGIGAVVSWVGGAASAAAGAVGAAAAGTATAVGAGAVAGTVGAVATTAAYGAITGAVIGAASAAVTGGDIMDGALKGAVVGGVSGGVMSGLGIASGTWTASEQLAAQGLSTSMEPLGAAGTGGTAGIGGSGGAVAEGLAAPNSVGISQASTGVEGIAAPNSVGFSANQTAAAPTASDVGMSAGASKGTGIGKQAAGQGTGSAVKQTGLQTTKNQTPKPSLWEKVLGNDNAMKVVTSVGEGAAKAMMTDEPERESQSEYLRKVQQMNLPGDYQNKIANIRVPDHWKEFQRVKDQVSQDAQKPPGPSDDFRFSRPSL